MRFSTMILGCGLVLTSCTNAVMYYETDKISLTAEGRPDASQPASFTFGGKLRAVMLVPSSEDAGHSLAPPGESTADKSLRAQADVKGEAVSAISYFDFKKRAGSSWFDDEITIESLLITGAAADGLNREEAQVAFAIAGELSSAQRRLQLSQLSRIRSELTTFRDQASEEHQAAIDEVIQSSNGAAMSLLTQCVPMVSYAWEGGSPGLLTENQDGIVLDPQRVTTDPFGAVEGYLNDLANSIAELEAWDLATQQDVDRAQFGVRMANAEIPDARALSDRYEGALESQTRLHRTLERSIGEHESTRQLFELWVDIMYR